MNNLKIIAILKPSRDLSNSIWNSIRSIYSSRSNSNQFSILYQCLTIISRILTFESFQLFTILKYAQIHINNRLWNTYNLKLITPSKRG